MIQVAHLLLRKHCLADRSPIGFTADGSELNGEWQVRLPVACFVLSETGGKYDDVGEHRE